MKALQIGLFLWNLGAYIVAAYQAHRATDPIKALHYNVDSTAYLMVCVMFAIVWALENNKQKPS